MSGNKCPCDLSTQERRNAAEMCVRVCGLGHCARLASFLCFCDLMTKVETLGSAAYPNFLPSTGGSLMFHGFPHAFHSDGLSGTTALIFPF
ncbi:hypothetical protein HAX54_033691, partial [Datura stramonium]|nr:hypothetical protein [Datura stramonium]